MFDLFIAALAIAFGAFIFWMVLIANSGLQSIAVAIGQ